jgi:hypothetical protein
MDNTNTTDFSAEQPIAASTPPAVSASTEDAVTAPIPVGDTREDAHAPERAAAVDAVLERMWTYFQEQLAALDARQARPPLAVLAAKMGCSRANVGQLLSLKNPHRNVTIRTLVELCWALNFQVYIDFEGGVAADV